MQLICYVDDLSSKALVPGIGGLIGASVKASKVHPKTPQH